MKSILVNVVVISLCNPDYLKTWKVGGYAREMHHNDSSNCHSQTCWESPAPWGHVARTSLWTLIGTLIGTLLNGSLLPHVSPPGPLVKRLQVKKKSLLSSSWSQLPGPSLHTQGSVSFQEGYVNSPGEAPCPAWATLHLSTLADQLFNISIFLPNHVYWVICYTKCRASATQSRIFYKNVKLGHTQFPLSLQSLWSWGLVWQQ